MCGQIWLLPTLQIPADVGLTLMSNVVSFTETIPAWGEGLRCMHYNRHVVSMCIFSIGHRGMLQL
jgi:hypothetical protein